MKFALLGATPRSLELLRRIVALGHEAVAIHRRPADEVALPLALEPVPVWTDWEGLLHLPDEVAVVVVGPETDTASDPLLDDQLRKLVQAGTPLFVVPPACEAIVGFELEMIRRDARGVVFSYHPERYHPVWRERLAGKGGFEQIVVEHVPVDRSRATIRAAFVRDVALLRLFLGSIARVSASGGRLRPGERPDLSQASVGLVGTTGGVARWSVMPPGTMEETRFALVGAEGTVNLAIPAAGPWRWSDGEATELTSPDLLAVALLEFEKATRGEAYDAPDWMESCRGVEALEAIDRSLERGRTIELHHEEISEEASFKGTMAVGGCLLLLVTLGLFLVVGGAVAVLGPRDGGIGWRIARFCLLAPFVVFLLLQLLSFGLAAHERKKRERGGVRPAEK